MKTSVSTLILLLGYIFSFAQEQPKLDNTVVKYKLCQYLLSCHAMIYTIIGETDIELKYYLGTKGYDYYEKANQQYIKLQDPQYEEISEDLRKNITGLLESYAQVYSDISSLNNPSVIIGLAFLDNIYKKTVLPEIWDKKLRLPIDIDNEALLTSALPVLHD